MQNKFILFFILLVGCQSSKLVNGEKPFFGTIDYDVKLSLQADSVYLPIHPNFYGSQMKLTIFKNGDIQQKFFHSSKNGLDIVYWDIDKYQIIRKYNTSDTLYISDATKSFSEIKKSSISRLDNSEDSAYSKNELSTFIKQLATLNQPASYSEYACFISNQYKLNASIYKGIAHDLWYDILLLTNGQIPLDYQENYYLYKISYDMSSIRVKEQDHYKEMLHKNRPRVFVQ